MGAAAVQFYIETRNSLGGYNSKFSYLECGGAGNAEGCSPLQFPLQFYIERRALVGATILNWGQEFNRGGRFFGEEQFYI